MDSIIIKGDKPLIGKINISGSKNASLPIMAASLLTSSTTELSNIPKLTDIATMQQLIESHGATVSRQKNDGDSLTLEISAANIDNYTAHYDIVRKMRASIWVLGPLLARFGQAIVSLPGGCAIGARQVDLHIAVLESMKATIEIKEGYIHANVKNRLKACNFSFSRISVGATITGILAAVLADGQTHLSNCAKEPEITDLCQYLIKMGAEIKGIGTDELRINGKTSLGSAKYRVMPDRIEAGSYIIATAATEGDVTISGINPDIVENLMLRMKEVGTDFTVQENTIRVKHEGAIQPADISTEPYPGFVTDLQAQFMSLMTISTGSSIITENIFENRFMHVPELCRMGANINVSGNHSVVRGVESLSGAEVMASDLRASMSLIIAALAAKGTTKIRRVYHLDRGYQLLEQKLSACGADIRRVSGDTV